MRRMACTIIGGWTLLFTVVTFAEPANPPSCDIFVAMQDATTDGSIILAKNSDRPPMEAQPLVHVPRTDHSKGEMVKCTYIEIPSCPLMPTYSVRA